MERILAACRGDEICGHSRRRVLLAVDIFLCLAILWALLAPSGSGIGPSTGYREPDLQQTLRDQETARQAVGDLPRPWMAAARRRHRNETKHGKKKRHKKKHGRKQRKERQAAEQNAEKAAAAAAAAATASRQLTCGTSLRAHVCSSSGRRVVVTLSLGKRTHFSVTRLTMEAYAKRVGADFVVVNSLDHASLAAWNASARAGTNSHFMKLPLLQWFLRRYDQLLFLDDDLLVSPFAPDVFSAVPCASIGAVYEGYHKQGWHAMHGRSFCSLYGLVEARPSVCSPEEVKRVRVFNSGVMVLSSAHLPLLDGWDRRSLQCKILCDQLYMNAMAHQHDVCVRDLGDAFNLPGTAVRRLLATSESELATLKQVPSVRGTAAETSCFLHLTVLPAKQYTSHYLLKRSLTAADVMQCNHSTRHAPPEAERQAMLRQLPNSKYDIQKIWCKGRKAGCTIIPPAGATLPEGVAAAVSALDSPSPPLRTRTTLATVNPAVQARCQAHLATSQSSAPPIAATVSNASEMPPSARRILHRAAGAAWDCNTVILLFATGDFFDLAINWAQQAQSVGVTNFVLVAMDRALGEILDRFDAPPGLLLPRVAQGAVTISKLNVIGERQRFGLRVLESGFNVLFADLDALFLRSPAPILADGDIIGERIWGRPISVVKKWGAAICTGFYFVRSTPQTIAIFRDTQQKIVTKRSMQPRWQASDQWAINHAVDDANVQWETSTPMKPISDFQTKFADDRPAWGYTRSHRSKFVVLPHVHVARSCPILRHGTAPPPKEEKGEQKKWQLWNHLLTHAYALHCFPPDSMPCPKQKHGEKGCDKSVIMGSAVHIHGEVVFDQRQGLWFMKADWEIAIKEPHTKDFFAWLRSQHNGALPGKPPPPA